MKSITHTNPAGTTFTIAALLTLVMLLGAALLWTPAAGDEPAEPLWSAEMTVVEYTSVSIGAASADLFANVGGSGNLQIKSLWSHIPDRDLRLAFQEDLEGAAEYTLQAGSLTLEFPADSSGASSFRWTGLDIPWQDGQVIHVRIALTSEIDSLPPNPTTPEESEITGTSDGSEEEQPPLFLVSNLNVNPDSGIIRPLNASRSGFAQEFTTGATADGYALGSVGVGVSLFPDESAAADHLRMTINAVKTGGGPGDAVCTLTNPLSFQAPGVITFNAPTGDGACPELSAETTYSVVIEWMDPSGTDTFALIPQTYASEETAATEEDAGGADGWSIADQAHYLGVSSNIRTWTSFDETASFKIKLDGTSPEQSTGSDAENNPATGAPTISGTPQVGETLTADTSAVYDADGLDQVSYEYQWLADGTEVSGATASSYMLTTSDQGQTIQVRVSFTDDGDNQESLTSTETLAVAAKPNTAAAGEPTISGTPQVDETLTAETSAISDEDGLTNVSWQYQWLRDDADIAGQTDSTYRLVSADEGRTIKVQVTFSDDAGNLESLTSAATTAVAAQPTTIALLAAAFGGMPADHNGDNFTFQLNFSENVEAGYARIRNDALTVTGATIASATRQTQGSNQGWNIEVDPTGNGAVTITLPETTDCDATGAICTSDSRKLYHPTSATVAGPPAVSVSDAAATEEEGATLEFTVSFSHASSRTVTVAYATSDRTATSGADYTAASGTLTFNPGSTSQTVQVAVLTDSDDEEQETLTLTLSNPSNATLADAAGTGTIEDGESSSDTQDDPPAEDPPATLTATFNAVPVSHDGGLFTFELDFSVNVKSGYANIRDHALSLDVGKVKSAQRRTQGSNQYWLITVDPEGNGDVTVTLPVTTDCNAAGAICDYEGNMLSNSPSATVQGT